MTEMRMVPSNVSRGTLELLLTDMLERVKSGDSFEGSIQYTIPTDENAPPDSVDVQASYRVGNLMGQGSMRMVGQWAEVQPDGTWKVLREVT